MVIVKQQQNKRNWKNLISYCLGSDKKLVNKVMNFLRSLKRSIAIRDTAGVHLITRMLIALKWRGITHPSIKDITVKGFLNVLCNGGEPNYWSFIMSEYYLIKGDEKASTYVRLVKEMEIIRVKAYMTELLCSCMALHYNEKLAELLREEYPQRKFQPDSYEKDLKFIIALEKNSKVRFETLRKNLDNIISGNGNKKLSKDERYGMYMNLIYDINKHEGHAAITMRSSLLELAIAEKRLFAYIKSMEDK